MAKKYRTEKVFIILEDGSVVVGMYYQGKFGRLTIGGNSRFLTKMRLLFEEYFKIHDYNMIITAKNKLKLVAVCSEKKYSDTVLQMHRDEVRMESTINLNRIWW